MTPPDDIPLDKTPSQTERPITPEDSATRRKVGPESEVRGGPEAPEDPNDDKPLTGSRSHGPQSTESRRASAHRPSELPIET